MKRLNFITLIFLIINNYTFGQIQLDIQYADSLIKSNSIPGLNFAIFTTDSILSRGCFGVKRMGYDDKLTFEDIMPIGSCTKSVTGLIAAKLVSQGYIKWNTDFFELYPELRKNNTPYTNLTLINLLSHRAEVPPLTGQNDEKLPKMELLLDTTKFGRLNLAKWILKQQNVPLTKTYNYSNGGYLLAALMMEKASGHTWEQLVFDYLVSQSITPFFNFPNEISITNVWLHDERQYPVAPEFNNEVGAGKPLAPGGLIFMKFTDAIKYVQLNMKGNIGKSDFLSKEYFQFIHCGLPEYSLGWGCRIINGNENILHRGNIGGRSWCLFHFIPLKNIGVVIMTNSGDQQTGIALNQLRDYLISKYIDRN
jgi:CubicO group peptidase (beta-lactamase class C family)